MGCVISLCLSLSLFCANQVMSADGRKEAALVLRLQILNQSGMAEDLRAQAYV